MRTYLLEKSRVVFPVAAFPVTAWAHASLWVVADMLEEERNYKGVDILRELFWREDGLDACLERALYETLLFLQEKQAEVYPLTQDAYNFYKKKE